MQIPIVLKLNRIIFHPSAWLTSIAILEKLIPLSQDGCIDSKKNDEYCQTKNLNMKFILF